MLLVKRVFEPGILTVILLLISGKIDLKEPIISVK